MAIDYDRYPTFFAASTAFTPGATPQDVFTITGSATKNIHILQIAISTTQTTPGYNVWFLAKRSTANSGGTSSSIAPIAANSNKNSATATVRQYTANPTAGSLFGNIWGGWVPSPDRAPASGAGAAFGDIVVNFEDILGGPVTLIDETEVLSWNFNGAALPTGLSVLAWVKWVESSKS